MSLIPRSSRRFIPRVVDYTYSERKPSRMPIRRRLHARSGQTLSGLVKTTRRNPGDERG